MRISLLVSSGFDGLLPLLDALGLSILNRIIASATSDRGTVYLRMSLVLVLGISPLVRFRSAGSLSFTHLS